MFASDKLIGALNEQIGHELAAEHQYIAIAAHFDGEALPMLAKLFYEQAEEEREHAMKFVRFLVDIDAAVEVPEVPAPKASFKTAEEAVEHALESEKKVTRQIDDLVERARSEKSNAALRFLDWFVTEQVEEVSKMSGLLDVVRRAGEERILQVEDHLAEVDEE